MTTPKTLCLIATVAVCALMACNQSNKAKQAEVNTHTAADSDTVSVATASKYVKNYASRAGVVHKLMGDKGTEGTRCIWFDIDRLDSLVEKIREEGGSGIRFYLAAYDARYDTLKVKHHPRKAYWGYNTLIMVSTRNINGINRDYYTNLKGTGEKTGHIVLMTDPENRGEICPPPANCNDIGATLLSPN